ncbi:unnamed protein product [Ilex paraguariensis]|uniref:50S ribosomal protein 6, chloroplastic n=1 Tax=Ilex paraguariensis TaxID=185542 RepID=A0ABC8UNK4_9AQUA
MLPLFDLGVGVHPVQCLQSGSEPPPPTPPPLIFLSPNTCYFIFALEEWEAQTALAKKNVSFSSNLLENGGGAYPFFSLLVQCRRWCDQGGTRSGRRRWWRQGSDRVLIAATEEGNETPHEDSTRKSQAWDIRRGPTVYPPLPPLPPEWTLVTDDAVAETAVSSPPQLPKTTQS